MKGKTHVIGGLTAGLSVAYFTYTDPIILVSASVVGSLIPDICHSGSRLGKNLPILSRLINFVFGHRSFTHSLVFLILTAFLVDYFFPNDALKIGLLAGMISHYILDMGTKSGIQLFFPIDFKVKFPITTRTGSHAEKLIFSLLWLVSLYLAFQVFSLYIYTFINDFNISSALPSIIIHN